MTVHRYAAVVQLQVEPTTISIVGCAGAHYIAVAHGEDWPALFTAGAQIQTGMVSARPVVSEQGREARILLEGPGVFGGEAGGGSMQQKGYKAANR
jgi:hypothetical protein